MFLNWTDQDGRIVSEKETFIPLLTADSRDCVYTANFLSRTYTTFTYRDDDVDVIVTAPLDALPEGAEPFWPPL